MGVSSFLKSPIAADRKPLARYFFFCATPLFSHKKKGKMSRLQVASWMLLALCLVNFDQIVSREITSAKRREVYPRINENEPPVDSGSGGGYWDDDETIDYDSYGSYDQLERRVKSVLSNLPTFKKRMDSSSRHFS